MRPRAASSSRWAASTGSGEASSTTTTSNRTPEVLPSTDARHAVVSSAAPNTGTTTSIGVARLTSRRPGE